MSLPSFVDVKALAAVANLGLRARLVVEGFYAGLHRSRFKGFSVEFAEYRSYQPGDDLRLVDWRAYARTDRYYVREFEAETNLRFILCLDASGSMAYPPQGPMTKFAYAATAAAALAYLALGQRDAVGVATFGDKITALVPPRSGRQHFGRIVDVLERAVPAGRTDLYATLAALADRVHRRALLAVFTDLWDASGRVFDGLRALRGGKHEVLLFHVLDAREEDFAFARPATFVDMETAETVDLDGPRYRASYGEALRKLKEEYRLALGARDIEYVPLVTDVPPAYALASYLGRRGRLP